MKRARICLLICLAHIALLASGLRLHTDTPPRTNKRTGALVTQPHNTAHPRTRTRTQTEKTPTGEKTDTDTLNAFQQTDFYRTIVQNNLFQPLGTQPAAKSAQYTLLGTTTPPDGRIGGTAYLQHTHSSDKTLISVTIGERLGDATVVDIQPKQVTLDAAGRQTTLKLQHPLWLKK